MSPQQHNNSAKKNSKSRKNRRFQSYKNKRRTQRLNDISSNVEIVEEMDQSVMDEFDQNMKEDVIEDTAPAMSEASSSSKVQYKWMSPSNKVDRSKSPYLNLSIDNWKNCGFLVPQYIKMGRSLFQESLSNAIPHHRHDILQWLTNHKVFNFVKQQAHDAAIIYGSEMELSYWNSMITAAEPTLAVLSSESRGFTRKNNIHWDYPQTEQNVRHRQLMIQNRLNQYKEKLNKHMEKESFIGMTAESMDIIREASNTMIETQFRIFYTKLNEKLTVLQYDLYDVYLVKSFYDMSPNEEQIAAVRRIWRLKNKSGQRAIARSKKVAEGTIENNDSNENAGDRFNSMLLNASITPSMRTIVEARLANMEQRKQQIINFVAKHSSVIEKENKTL